MTTIFFVLSLIGFRLGPDVQFALVGYLLTIMFFVPWTEASTQ